MKFVTLRLLQSVVMPFRGGNGGVLLHSPRLSSLHRRPSTHFRTIGQVDWRFVGIERCSST